MISGNQTEERELLQARDDVVDVVSKVFNVLNDVMQSRDQLAHRLQGIRLDCASMADDLASTTPEWKPEVRGGLLQIADDAAGIPGRSVFRWSIAVLIQEFMAQDPPNYLAWPVHTGEGVYEVKVTRPNGRNEHQLLCDRTEERNWLLHKFDLLRAWFDAHPEAGDEEVEEIFRLVEFMAENGGAE